MVSAVPTGGLTWIFTPVPPGTTFTLKEISTSSPGLTDVTSLFPIVVVNVLVVSLVLLVRTTGAVSVVEKTISILVRSIGADCDMGFMVKKMVSIPVSGLDDNP